MNCPESREKLQLLLDDQLAESEANALRRHLADCKACRRQFEEWESLKRELAELPPVTPPADLLPRMKAALRREAAETSAGGSPAPSSPSWLHPGRWRAVAALLMLGLGVALLIHERPTPREDASGWAAGDDEGSVDRSLELRREDPQPEPPAPSTGRVTFEETKDRKGTDRGEVPGGGEKAKTSDRKALIVTEENFGADDEDGAKKRGWKKPGSLADRPPQENAPATAADAPKLGTRRTTRGRAQRPRRGGLELENDSAVLDELAGLYALAFSRLEEAEKAKGNKWDGAVGASRPDERKVRDATSKAPRDVVIVLRGDEAVTRLMSWARQEKLALRDLPVTPIAAGGGPGGVSGGGGTGAAPQPTSGGKLETPREGRGATKGRVFLVTVAETRLAALEKSLAGLGRQGVSLQRLSPLKRSVPTKSGAGTAPRRRSDKKTAPSAPARPEATAVKDRGEPKVVRILLVVPSSRH